MKPNRHNTLKLHIQCSELTPKLWPAFETLFGGNGACGGCWCMFWRTEKGERWDDIKGPAAKRRMKALVLKGRALGVLAFVDDEPVGWCAYGPRTDFSKLNRSRTLACDDANRVWSIPCFYVKAGFRDKGVASALLAHAVSSLAARGIECVEGYPVKPSKTSAKIPAAFAWTGTQSLFAAQGFDRVGRQDAGKQRVRRRP